MKNIYDKLRTQDSGIALFIFFITLLYFSFNCPPNVTVEDSGDFIMGLSSLGIVHGPSFPLYTMLGFIFSKFPIGEVGFRIALLSSFFGSLTLAFLYIFLRQIKIAKVSAIFSVIALALTSVFMGQSIIAEVYSLNVFLVLLLFMFTNMANKSLSPWWVFLMGLTTGSGLIHHYPLFMASCSGLIFLFEWKTLNTKKIIFGVIGTLIGLLPFVYLIFQMNNKELAYNFGKVTNWEMLWKQFLREGYRGVDEAGGDFTDKLILSWTVLKFYLIDFKALIIFFPLGLFLARKKVHFISLLISTLSSSYLIIFLLGFTSKVHHQAVIKAYLLPHFLFVTIFIAYGINWVLEKVESKRLVATVLLSLLVLTQGLTNFKDTSHYNDDFIYLWAKRSLESLEPNSVLILCGQEPYALYYVNQFMGIRADVTIYDRLSIMTKENLYSPDLLFWGVKSQKSFDSKRLRKEIDFLKKTKRPVYLTCRDKFKDHGFPLKATIYHHRVINNVPFVPTPESQILSADILNSAIAGYPKTEYWLDAARNMVLYNAYSFYLNNKPQELTSYLQKLKSHKNFNDQDFVHAMLEEAFKAKKYQSYERIINWFGTSRLNSASLARYCTYKAGKKEFIQALKFCELALLSAKECSTSLYNNLMFVTFHMKKYKDSKKWASRLLKCDPSHKGAKSLLNSIK